VEEKTGVTPTHKAGGPPVVGGIMRFLPLFGGAVGVQKVNSIEGKSDFLQKG